MVYQSSISKLNKWVYAILIIFLIVLSIPAILEDSYEPLIAISSIDLVLFLFLFWTYKTTQYTIKNDILHWKSGPFYGEIVINSITKIAHHNGIIVPTFWKPALSHIGLIITYNKFDDIYISPEKSENFLAQLLEINPNITIKN
jgi:hypothetical protein